MLQQACDLLMDPDDRGQRVRFVIHDRDAKFSRPFDSVFQNAGVEAIRTPMAPNGNAYIEPWGGTLRRASVSIAC
jgi:putative transposase